MNPAGRIWAAIPRAARSLLAVSSVLSLVASLPVHAQPPSSDVPPPVPTLVRLGGTLTVAEGPVLATFALYAEETGGEALWSEAQAVAVGAGGRYSVLLGSTVADGIPPAVCFALYLSKGDNNVGVGAHAGQNLSQGSLNTFIGYSAGYSGFTEYLTLSNATAIGANARVTQDDSLVLGDTNVSVGIGTAAPNTKLQVVGDIRIGTSGTNGCVKRFDATAVAGTCSSDARLKTDVSPVGPVLGRVSRLEPVRFRWRADEFPDRHLGNAVNVGLIAQDVEEVFPELVSADEQGYKLISASELPYLTIAAVKELKAENDALKAQLAVLGERLARLEKGAKQREK